MARGGAGHPGYGAPDSCVATGCRPVRDIEQRVRADRSWAVLSDGEKYRDATWSWACLGRNLPERRGLVGTRGMGLLAEGGARRTCASVAGRRGRDLAPSRPRG